MNEFPTSSLSGTISEIASRTTSGGGGGNGDGGKTERGDLGPEDLQAKKRLAVNHRRIFVRKVIAARLPRFGKNSRIIRMYICIYTRINRVCAYSYRGFRPAVSSIL